MILRRLATSIRKQDWFAVVIETLIVVMGVYLGIQLGNWNANQQDRASYRDSFNRVIVELQMNLESVKWDQEAIRERLPVVQEGLEVLRACQTGPEALAKVNAALEPLEWDVEFTLDTPALEQLIGNERFLSFQGTDTRDILMSLLAELSQMEEFSADLNDLTPISFVDRWSVIKPGDLSYDSPDDLIAAFEEGTVEGTAIWRQSKLAIPLADACKNEVLMALFYTWEVDAYWHSLAAYSLIAELESALDALGYVPQEAADD
ncbi:MAG: hypothetical protein CMK07_00620 [Ponticaulis sp.]|nr:hypothetical protein [Ponticaulis sp.]